MKDVIKLICHLPPTSCELNAFKNCVIRNAVGEEKLSKASLADVLFEVELTAFKLQSVLQHRSHHMLSACKLCQLEWCRHYRSNERQETFLHTTLKRQKIVPFVMLDWLLWRAARPAFVWKKNNAVMPTGISQVKSLHHQLWSSFRTRTAGGSS